MLDDKIKPEDIKLLRLILRHYPEVDEVFRVLRLVLSGANFPIKSAVDVEQALGGEDEQFTFHGRLFPVRLVREMVPAYYFPIASEDDLVAKVADLRARQPIQPELYVEGAAVTPLTVGGSGPDIPPFVSSEEIARVLSSGGTAQFGVVPLPKRSE